MQADTESWGHMGTVASNPSGHAFTAGHDGLNSHWAFDVTCHWAPPHHITAATTFWHDSYNHLHPHCCYDDREPQLLQRKVIMTCVSLGRVVSGHHCYVVNFVSRGKLYRCVTHVCHKFLSLLWLGDVCPWWGASHGLCCPLPSELVIAWWRARNSKKDEGQGVLLMKTRQ